MASNVCPREMAQFVKASLEKDWDKAEDLDRRLSSLFRDLFIEPNPIPGKAAMAQLGLMENQLRLPLVPATDETETAIRKTLAALWK